MSQKGHVLICVMNLFQPPGLRSLAHRGSPDPRVSTGHRLRADASHPGQLFVNFKNKSYLDIFQNLGTALITMAAGTIVDEYGYDWLEVRENENTSKKYLIFNFKAQILTDKIQKAKAQ